MLKPLGDRVILKVAEAKEETVGGIVLANNAKQKPQTGKVVAVGDGKLLDNGEKAVPEVKVDDEVLFDKYAGSEVEYDSEKYLIVHVSDIMAIID